MMKSLTNLKEDNSELEFDQQNNSIHINMLPKEMLILIVKKLSFKNIKNVLLVCRYWRTLGADPVLWKKFQFLFIKDPAFLLKS